MALCTVSMIGQYGNLLTGAYEASSLFDAVDQFIMAECRGYEWSSDAVITVESNGQTWRVAQTPKLRAWRHHKHGWPT